MPFPRFRLPAFLLASALVFPVPSSAYDVELSDTAVRNAYFLGQRRDQQTRMFFEPYIRRLPLPKSGPYISEIRLLTPLAQVVEVSQTTSGIYSAQQAQLDYRARGDSILLEIHIEFTPTYNQIDAQRSSSNAAGEKGITLRSDDFWQDFRFGIKQKQDWIEARSTHGEPQYALADGYGASGGLIGAWVWVEYGARNVSSDDTEVHVLTPDGQDVSVKFDLDTLK
jgi:hypothetical protein